MFSRSTFLQRLPLTATAASLLLTACGTQPLRATCAAATPSGNLTGRITVGTARARSCRYPRRWRPVSRRPIPACRSPSRNQAPAAGSRSCATGPVDLIGVFRPINSAEIGSVRGDRRRLLRAASRVRQPVGRRQSGELVRRLPHGRRVEDDVATWRGEDRHPLEPDPIELPG